MSGRKHLLEHQNRRDHIKEQNIVETSRSEPRQFEDKSTLTDRQPYGPSGAQRGSPRPPGPDEQLEFERQLELADEEESAAVAEIQRCTREALESQQVGSPQSGAEVAARQQAGAQTATMALALQQAERSQASSRHSRQQRVCQNQSFYINENDYPEPRGGHNDNDYCIKIGGRETGGAGSSLSRASQREQTPTSPYHLAARSEKAKNLFRESPDFILTTGQVRQQLTDRTTTTHQASGHINKTGPDGSPVGATAEGAEGLGSQANGRSIGAAGAGPCPCSSSCRVLNLDDRYDFVGLKAGHKYFVERELHTKESMLVGETA